MGLLSRAENVVNSVDSVNIKDGDASQPALKKIKISKKNLGVLKKRVAEYQKVYRIFGCILLENQAQEKGKPDFCEKLAKMTGNMGIASPINQNHALILLPSEMDRELIAHRLSKSLDAEPVLSFRAANPEYVINRINSMS
jgi:hypothetical protein